MKLIRCFHNPATRAYGYAPTWRSDFVFVFILNATGSEPGEECEAKDLVDHWSDAPAGSSPPRQRSVLFFPDTGGDLGKIAEYAEAAASNAIWGSFYYWQEADPSIVPIGFPSEAYSNIGISGNVSLDLWQGNQPLEISGLDALNITWDDSSLKLARANCKWRVRYKDEYGNVTPLAESADAFLDLDRWSPGDERSGAILVTGGGEALRHTELSFSRLLISDDYETFECDHALRAKPFDQFTLPDSECHVAMDARDIGIKMPKRNQRLCSRLEFQDQSQLLSNFTAEQGNQMLLVPERRSGRGLLRFQLRMNSGSIDNKGTLEPDPSPAIFVPEGTFYNAGFRVGKEGSDTTGAKRLLAGGSTTEFVEVRFGDSLVFTRDFPSEMVDEDTMSYISELDSNGDPPEAVVRLANAEGLLTTPWVNVHRATNDLVGYVTEPVCAPQFDATSNKEVPSGALGRVNVQLGDVGRKYLALFPLLGRVQTAQSLLAEAQGRTDYDTSHLAEARRTVFRPPGSKLGKSGGVSRDLSPPPPNGVTPQGILSARQVSGDFQGDFKALYFGSAEPEYRDGQGDTQNREEFRLRVEAPTSGPESEAGVFYEKLQLVLRGSDLFMVFNKREDYTEGVVTPEVDIALRGFQFQIRGIDAAEGVFIVKYFKNRSLYDLAKPDAVTDGLWACKQDLAPKLTPVALSDLVTAASTQSWYGEFKKRVWENPDWQGVLFLNLAPENMPPLFEALKGGMKESNLKFHHFGLDFMPVKSGDLGAASPSRLAAAFGVLRYAGGDAPVWESDDTIPEDPSPPDPPPQLPQLNYNFTVKTLELSFFNSQIKDFQAEVEVGFSHLFWDAIKSSDQDGTEKLLLKGSYESRPGNGGASSDLFRLRMDVSRKFKFDSGSWINTFDFLDAELSVLSTDSDSGERRIRSFLGMSGTLAFNADKLPIERFVMLKSVTVHKMGAEYDYYPDDPSEKKRRDVRFKIEDADVDAEVGPAANEFLAWLPVKFTGFKMAFKNVLKLPDLGFLDIGGLDSGFDFGIKLEFDLGNLGRLAGFKDLKLPGLFGWRRALEGFAFGIQFPNGTTNEVRLTILDIIGIKFKAIQIKTCNEQALSLFFEQIQLVLFGKDIPSKEDVKLNFGLFMPTGGGEQRKLAWMAGAQINDSSIPVIKYVGGGYRIRVPQAKEVTSTKSIVDAYKDVLDLQDNPCDWIDKRDANENGWVVVSELKYDGLFEAWLALSDAQNIYGIRLNLVGLIELDAFYRRVTEGIGIYSAELNLSSIIPPIQIGVASLTLPSIRIEIHTDGGFLLDLGFPWDHDYRRSFKIEVGIFTGGGGFYFGSMSMAAVDILMLKENVGEFSLIDLENPDHLRVVKLHRALRAGIAFRGGIGRSFDLGILKGEASLTFYGSLEGAVAMRGGTTRPRLYAVQGTVGIMLHIWVEIDFFVLQAKAELLAYAEAGFIIRRVLAHRPGDNTFHYLTLPVVLFFEVGLYVHVEVWITIGCVSVKLFDLSYRGTWRFEAEMGGMSSDLVDGSLGSSFLPQSIDALTYEKGFDSNYQAWEGKKDLLLYATLVPSVASPADLDQDFGSAAPHYPAMVAQLAADPLGAFTELAQFMVAWALGIQNPTPASAVGHAVVMEMRRHFKESAPWMDGEMATIIDMLNDHFELDIRALTPDVKVNSFAAIPFWPGLSWEFENESKFFSSRILVPAREGQPKWTKNGATLQFIDFLRGLTNSFLEEIDWQLKYDTPSETAPGTFTRTWKDVWDELAKQ